MGATKSCRRTGIAGFVRGQPPVTAKVSALALEMALETRRYADLHQIAADAGWPRDTHRTVGVIRAT